MALSFTLAAGWIPFVVVLVLTLLFSAIYIRYYMSKYDSELSTTLTAIFALTVTLLTSDLVPVDIFLVSFMKNQDGTFKDWAKDNSTRNSLEDSVLYAYYSLYGIICVCFFLLLPFMYFFYEEKDENSTCRSRTCTALKYLIVFIIIAVVLSLIGAFVPTKSVPSSNSTEWIKIKGLFEGLASNGGEDALSFVICVFSLLGMLGLITYTAYGMSALPMELVAGRKSTKKERMAVQSNRSNVESHRETIRAKYGLSRSTSTRYQRRNAELEEQERQLARQERHLAASENSWCQKCLTLLRPFEIVLGVVCFLLALLVFISLLLTNIDKAMNSLGYKFGFALPHRHLPNPIDIVLVFCQKLFPLDYILMTGVTVYFVLCSMTGVCRIGIWFFWIRMYKVRPRRTMPQGLLMFCMILMFLVLAINVVIYELTPQYSSFGSQHYLVNTTGLGNSTVTSLEPCSTDASSENCTITRMALLLTRFFYKMWFFGAAYYVCTWAFLGTFLLGFVIVLCRGRRSAIQGEVDSDDFDESDDELLHA
ncbi:probable lysosomal cobalamin transporter [Pomacea canaliculata]|uniref:probable lysosomal cobalamin transporter n=1 Tax=Pomacea canaliculata TaxID=400727 RepID=UPI000D72632A|nr:probable lysosomal cobalamin transporter [Pomacea canaliculata]